MTLHHRFRRQHRFFEFLRDFHGLFQDFGRSRRRRELAGGFLILGLLLRGLPGGFGSLPRGVRHEIGIDAAPRQPGHSDCACRSKQVPPHLVAPEADGDGSRSEVALRRLEPEQMQIDHVGRDVQQLFGDADLGNERFTAEAHAAEARVVAGDDLLGFFEFVVVVEQQHRQRLVERGAAHRVQIKPGVRNLVGDKARAAVGAGAIAAREPAQAELAVAEKREPQAGAVFGDNQQVGALELYFVEQPGADHRQQVDACHGQAAVGYRQEPAGDKIRDWSAPKTGSGRHAACRCRGPAARR